VEWGFSEVRWKGLLGNSTAEAFKVFKESEELDSFDARQADHNFAVSVVRLGAGESDLDLDSLTLTGFDARMGAGKTTVDLTGDYTQSFDASIEGGVGRATVLLPSEVGVKAKAEGGLGKINAKGLKQVGDSYVNGAYGGSDTNLNVDVKGGVGEINPKVV
jgi:hypothetical protein